MCSTRLKKPNATRRRKLPTAKEKPPTSACATTAAPRPELAREVLQTLETEFDEISTTLNYMPPEPIGVVLYTNQTFMDITRAPSWVGALNDGRIRVPVEGLTA